MHYSPEKQKQLLIDWRENQNQQSLNDLILSNKKLIIKEALNSIKGNNNIELEDLIQEGYIGLSMAVEKFDLTQDNSFVTYALFWVRQRIKSFVISNRSVVRLGTTSDNRKIFSSLPITMRAIEKEYGDTLTTEEKINEAAKRLDVKKSSLSSMMNVLSGYDKSFDQKVGGEDDESRTLLDLTPDEKVVEDDFAYQDGLNKFEIAISSVLENELTDEEALIIRRRFLKEEKDTYDDIAKSMRVSRQYIRTREAFALKKIKARIQLRFGLDKDDFFQ